MAIKITGPYKYMPLKLLVRISTCPWHYWSV